MGISSLAVRKKNSRLRLAASNTGAAATAQRAASLIPGSEQPDHFIVDESGNLFAGRHLIIDLWDVPGAHLADMELIKRTLAEATQISGATLLNIDLHRFEPNGGISGVAVLAESHISIHTWPERGYAAIDAFMCGQARPERSLVVLRRCFKPGKLQVTELKRGMVINGDD